MFFNQKKEKGFTLVELMVSAFVFALLAGAIAGILTSGIQSQRIILKEQKNTSEMSYVMEYISRDIRMAKKDVDGTCINTDNNYQLIGGNSIRFLNKDNKCHEYYLENNKIYQRKSDDKHSSGWSEIPLTSQGIYVENLNFKKTAKQPKITINLEFRDADEDDALTLQTTVSQRNLNK